MPKILKADSEFRCHILIIKKNKAEKLHSNQENNQLTESTKSSNSELCWKMQGETGNPESEKNQKQLSYARGRSFDPSLGIGV